MALDQDQIVQVYRRRAPRYDFTASLCARALLPCYRPFAVTLDLAERHPWKSIARHMKTATVSPWFFGFAYVATGEA